MAEKRAAGTPTWAAAGAGGHRPNVVYIVLDDTGFASTGAFGNDIIQTPNIDRLASEGLRYNNFHTTAICSATRASLLTGTNHHKAGVASLVDWSAGGDNAVGHVKHEYATIAEVLKTQGYATFAVGKWHLSRHQTPAGPFDDWPLGRGFDRFYGVLAGMGDQFHPQLVQDNGFVSQPREPRDGYHLSEDIVDHAIDYVFTQQEAFPNQSFFLYLAFGATHTPFQAPQAYLDKYRGRFDGGWDALRERWFANQKRLGVIPADAELTPRNELVPAWDELTADERVLAERFVEAFAGFLEHTDAQIGRVLDFLEEIGQLDNTLVVLLSDNGASGEGGRNGQFDSLRNGTGTTDPSIDADADAYALAHLDQVGGEFSYVHYNAGWANAFNTPFPWYKVLTFEGGIKDDLVVRYPAAVADPGAVRGQYLHVTDVTPTVLDVLGIQKPAQVKGVPQRPFTGVSFASTLVRADAPEVRHRQYYEILGNRAIYSHGWKAVVNHLLHAPDFSKDVWELYHVAEDYSEAHDVAAEHPEKLAELKAEFLLEAGRNDVFPLLSGPHAPYTPSGEPGVVDVAAADGAGGAGPGAAPVRRAVFEHVLRPFFIPAAVPAALSNRVTVDVDTSSHVVWARVRLRASDEGVIIAHGNRFGGFALYVRDRRLHYVYNANRVAYFEAMSEHDLPEGEVQLGFRLVGRDDEAGRRQFKGGHGKGADVTLYVNGEPDGGVHIAQTFGHPLGAVELKANHFTEVDPSYSVPFEFTGKLDEVVLEQLESSVNFENAWLDDVLRAD